MNKLTFIKKTMFILPRDVLNEIAKDAGVEEPQRHSRAPLYEVILVRCSLTEEQSQERGFTFRPMDIVSHSLKEYFNQML